MTASIRNVKTSYVTVKTVEDQEIKLENKERRIKVNQLKETLEKGETKSSSPRKTG